MDRVQKLFDACDRWLADPEDPARYEIGPRAEDVQVTYWEKEPDGRQVKRKDRLSTLLCRVSLGRNFIIIEMKQADPRELVLKTANTLRGALEMLLRVSDVRDLGARLDQLEKASEEREEAWATTRDGLKGLKSGRRGR